MEIIVMQITEAKDCINEFKFQLLYDGKSQLTVKTYLRSTQIFLIFSEDFPEYTTITCELLDKFRQYLIRSYQSSTANTYIIGFNCFLTFIKVHSNIKCIRRQDRDYIKNPISDEEHYRLLAASAKRKDNTNALYRTLTGTGIRVGELKYITVKAITDKRTEINNKGKSRTILINTQLCRFLEEYCKQNGIVQGIIFTGADASVPISSSTVWRRINSLYKEANVDKSKLFPHNLRHYFASTFFRVTKDIVVLKELLGHSDLKTTSIYTHADGEQIRLLIDSVVI